MVDASRTNDFWSRRRAAVEAEAAAEEAARRAAEAAEARAELEREQAEKTDEELLAELELSDPDTMGQGDDFAAFMRPSVPEHLRRRALRRLWRTNPVLANLDGLVDHGEDLSDAATVTADLRTAYQVGRGMLRHVAALAGTAPEPESAAPGDTAPEIDATDDGAAEALPATEEAPEPALAPRRHMRFSFDETTEGTSA
ncbi:DUF3306 domain-containing protein [Defluviimonas sp. SAOS-178_SWC]|uniref:DUF3306 domain-containing protein n=1 Tax=Defluviimonas sp. SAOS-178_SWC TaxID=3121287 RepID=UPI0032213ADC